MLVDYVRYFMVFGNDQRLLWLYTQDLSNLYDLLVGKDTAVYIIENYLCKRINVNNNNYEDLKQRMKNILSSKNSYSWVLT